MEVMELLTQAVEQNAADIFLVPGMPFSYKIGGRIICQGEEKIMPDQMNQMITRIYEIAKNRSMERVLSHGDDDFSFAIPGVSRFRANVFRQRGSLTDIIFYNCTETHNFIYPRSRCELTPFLHHR